MKYVISSEAGAHWSQSTLFFRNSEGCGAPGADCDRFFKWYYEKSPEGLKGLWEDYYVINKKGMRNYEKHMIVLIPEVLMENIR